MFLLLTGSIYCSLLLLDCFDFACGCVCVYSVTFSNVVINLCRYIGLLQFCGVLLFSLLFWFFSFLFLRTLIFQNLLYFSTFILLFAFPTVLFQFPLIFNVYKSSSSTCLTLHIYYFFPFFIFFPLNIFFSFVFIALFPTCHLALVLFSSLCLS